jgi:hypothetical protein
MRIPALLAIALVACGTDDSPDRRQFIQKAAHEMHPFAPPLSPDQVDALLDKNDDEVVAALYAEPASRDLVFRMSLAFLGAPIDQLHEGGGWAPPPFMYSPAVSAARAFRDGRDPVGPLFTSRGETATGIAVPVRDDIFMAFYGGAPLTGPNAQRRAYAAQAILADISNFRSYVAGLPEPLDVATLCNTYEMSVISVAAFYAPQILGVPDPITAAGNPREMDDPDAFPFNATCFANEPTTKAQALAKVDHAKSLFSQMFTRLEPIFAKWEGNPEGAFDAVDFDAIGFDSLADAGYYGASEFYPQFWNLAKNSSTNFNRRRGAYVLDRYFCDNLVPVGAALPAAHDAGKHASDPGCQACHFKLDPMAGYFRRNGYFGIEFSDAVLQQTGGMITFDDFATATFADYDKAWLAPAGSGRAYDVGYIRSTRDPSLNSYGSTLYDLDKLIGSAPEVQRCFAQRMFEYFNGADQAVDPGFLDDVATDMAGAGDHRFERGLERILTGNTFRATDRNSTVCYDLAPGADTKNRPPCEVASILRANCTSCHGGANPQSGLDLSVWEKGSDGELGFRHVVEGVTVDRKQTFMEMLDRVKTSDPTLQMPQGKDMPLRQREQLALWLQKLVD